MTNSSLLLRQSQAALSLGSSSGLRASATRLLNEQDLNSYGFASSSSAQSSSEASADGTPAPQPRAMESRRTIPPAFFRSVSPFIRLQRSKMSDYVPNLEPFSLQSQIDLRKQLEDCLQAPQWDEANRNKVWNAYIALSRAPTTEKPGTSVAVVNLLPYVDIETHRAVLHYVVPENAAASAFNMAMRRIKMAKEEKLPGLAYRAVPYRPPRRQHLDAVPVDPSAKQGVTRGPFILQQMDLASSIARSAGRNDDESTVTIDDYNTVLSMLADNVYLVPLSRIWIELTHGQIEGVRLNIQSYTIAVRALYTYIQNDLSLARYQFGLSGRKKRDRALERATFSKGTATSAATSSGPDGTSGLISDDDLQGPLNSRQRRLRTELDNTSRVALTISLAVTRLRTILETFNSDAALTRNHEGQTQEEEIEHIKMERQLVDYSLRILRLAGDMQHFAVLLRNHFGVRLGHPDVPSSKADGSEETHLTMTVSTLNTILMALGEHASARDMVVAYETLTRSLPKGPIDDTWGVEQREHRLRAREDDEDGDGLLSIGGGDGSRRGDDVSEAAAVEGNLFKIDWSALSFRADSAPAEQSQAPDEVSLPSSQPPSQRMAYSVHPTTTSLRILIRHLCTNSRPIYHSYASLTRTPLPRDDWAFQDYRYQPTGGQARKLEAAAIAEDNRRANGDYSLLALAYLREGVEAYQNSIHKMAHALTFGGSQRFFQPPPLVPTAACFRPLISVAKRKRNLRTLRSVAIMVQQSIALMEKESDLLKRAAKRWSSAFEDARAQEDAQHLSDPTPQHAGTDDIRKTLLGDVLAAIRRQSAICEQELDALKVLLSGPSASSSATPTMVETSTHRLDQGYEQEGFLFEDESGGLEALCQKLGQRRRKRFVAKRAGRKEEAQAQSLKAEAEAEQRRLVALKREERERIRRRASGATAAVTTSSSSQAGAKEAASKASSDVNPNDAALESR